jgi:hypothetical protein
MRHWKYCSQNKVSLDLPFVGVHYIQAQAWGLKGYLGGQHSCLVFNHQEVPIVVEITDRDTLMCQDGVVLFDGTKQKNYQEMAPFISTRSYDRQWFGNDPKLICSLDEHFNYSEIVTACSNYPFEFDLLTRNCNTFCSYLLWKLNINMRTNSVSIGFKPKNWWQKNMRLGY